MATLPPIPERPSDRPETLAEYHSRRAAIAMHRQAVDPWAALIDKTIDDRLERLAFILESMVLSARREAIDDELYRKFVASEEKEPE